METQKDEIQKELFEELSQGPKRRFLRSRAGAEQRMLFTVTYENLIFIVITLVLVAIAVFVLGVEKGKRTARLQTQKIAQAPVLPRRVEMPKKLVAAKLPQPIATPKVTTTTPLPPAAKPETKPAIEAPLAPSVPPALPPKPVAVVPKPYTLQVATYKNKTDADKEASALSKQGHLAFIVQSGRFYQICVGEFTTKQEAQEVLNKLKSRYKDGFIKKR